MESEYKKYVELKICIVCEHYGSEGCDAGAGHSFRDENGECPAEYLGPIDTEYNESRNSFEPISLARFKEREQSH